MPFSEQTLLAKTVTLADFTCPGLLVPRLRGADAPAVIHELCSAAEREGYLVNMLPFYNAVTNREYLAKSEAPTGWAMPCAEIKGLSRPWFAVGRCLIPINWSGSRVGPVSTVILTAIPDTGSSTYSQLTAGLARLGRSTALSRLLSEAENPVQMMELLQEIGLRLESTRTMGRQP